MIPEFTDDFLNTASSSAHPATQQERGLELGDPQVPGDPVPSEDSHAGRHAELTICGNDGQHQQNLQDSCSSPPKGRARETVSKKRLNPNPSPGGADLHSQKKRSKSDDEAPSADTTSDHPASVIKEIQEKPQTTKKVPFEDWRRLEFVIKSLYLSTSVLEYQDLSDITQAIPLIQQRMKALNSTDYKHTFHSDSAIKHTFIQKLREIDPLLPPEVVKEKRQFAFYFLREKSGSFRNPFTFFLPKKDEKSHSEDFIVKEIKYLIKDKTITEYSELWIYTVNSPCMGRKHTDPCMIQLASLSEELTINFNIKMYVAFTKPYGPKGSIKKYFTSHKTSKGLNSSSTKDSPELNIEPETKERILTENIRQSRFHIKNHQESKKLCKDVRKKYTELLKTSPNTDTTKISKTIKDLCLKCPESPHTFDEFKNMGRESLRKLIIKTTTTTNNNNNNNDNNNNNAVWEEFESAYLNWWDANLEQSYNTFLDEKLSEGINREAVQLFILHLQNCFQNPSTHYNQNSNLCLMPLIHFIELPEIQSLNEVPPPADDLN